MKIKPVYIILALAVAAIAVLLVIRQSLARELFIIRQNNAALLDSVRVEQNKVGELESVKLVLVGDKDRLEKLNADLVDELEKERGKVKTIVKFETVIERDTMEIPTVVTVLPENNIRLDWNYEDIQEGGARFLADPGGL